MRVLVACEYSGCVRQAFRDRGHHAVSCDLHEPAEDGSPWHIAGDALRIAYEGGWDLMIAHPPCTHLAVSGARWWKDKAQEQANALAFVQALMDAPIERICIENPISKISTAIRKPDQVIQPWQFGHDASKSTCLWLKNLPPLRPTSFIDPRYICCGIEVPNNDQYGCPNCCGDRKASPRWGNQCDSGQNKLTPSPDRWKERSRTYQGIANAMASQWG